MVPSHRTRGPLRYAYQGIPEGGALSYLDSVKRKFDGGDPKKGDPTPGKGPAHRGKKLSGAPKNFFNLRLFILQRFVKSLFSSRRVQSTILD